MTPRIIDDQSPLNRLPSGLHPVQRGWLEGLRFSIDIADLAMRRLAIVLYDLAERATTGGALQQTTLEPDAYTAAMTDSWTFVDAAWRLKRFLIDGRIPRPPGPPQQMPSGTAFQVDLVGLRTALDGVKNVRDGFQHLDNRAARMAEEGEPVWGYLNWVTLNPIKQEAQTCALVPGSCGLGSSTFNLVNPAGKAFATVVDYVILNAFGHSVDLSELHRQILRATRSLESVLFPQFEGHPPSMSTFLISLTATFGTALPEGSTTPDASGSASPAAMLDAGGAADTDATGDVNDARE